MMQQGEDLDTTLSLLVPLHIDGHTLADMVLRSYPVDTLLHLSMATIPAFHRVGGRGQLGIIQEGQRFFNVGRKQFLERLPQRVEPSNAAA